jgi:hypothetical protein
VTEDYEIEIDSCFDQYNKHVLECRICDLWTHCAVGHRLLRDAAKQAERRLAAIVEPKAKA